MSEYPPKFPEYGGRNLEKLKQDFTEALADYNSLLEKKPTTQEEQALLQEELKQTETRCSEILLKIKELDSVLYEKLLSQYKEILLTTKENLHIRHPENYKQPEGLEQKDNTELLRLANDFIKEIFILKEKITSYEVINLDNQIDIDGVEQDDNGFTDARTFIGVNGIQRRYINRDFKYREQIIHRLEQYEKTVNEIINVLRNRNQHDLADQIQNNLKEANSL